MSAFKSTAHNLFTSRQHWLLWFFQCRHDVMEGKDCAHLYGPQSARNSAKVETLESFWYGSLHSNQLCSHIKTWLKNIPDDGAFYYQPSIFHASWIPAEKLVHAMEVIDATDKLNDEFYDAIQLVKIYINNESELFSWIGKQSVNQEQFIHVYYSSAEPNLAVEITQMKRQYQLSGMAPINHQWQISDKWEHG